MRLDQGMCKPAPLKGNLLIYSKELTGILNSNSQLTVQSFHSVLPGDQGLHYDPQPQHLHYVYWKHHLHKAALQL